MNKRVVITGMGTINPLGDSLDLYYNNLIAGKSGIKRWESLDMTGV
ncbi:beta-ketoacyl synthase N-terminal-like domain-containing protein, partial [Salinispira pacifica]